MGPRLKLLSNHTSFITPIVYWLSKRANASYTTDAGIVLPASRVHLTRLILVKVKSLILSKNWVWFILRLCQHDDGFMTVGTHIKVHTDERTQVHSARSSLVVTHPSTNRGWSCLTSVNVSFRFFALIATVSHRISIYYIQRLNWRIKWLYKRIRFID